MNVFTLLLDIIYRCSGSLLGSTGSLESQQLLERAAHVPRLLGSLTAMRTPSQNAVPILSI